MAGIWDQILQQLAAGGGSPAMLSLLAAAQGGGAPGGAPVPNAGAMGSGSMAEQARLAAMSAARKSVGGGMPGADTLRYIAMGQRYPSSSVPRYGDVNIPPYPTMQNPSNYNGGRTGITFDNTPPQPPDWTTLPVWGGQGNPLNNVPLDEWPTALQVAQLGQYERRNAFDQSNTLANQAEAIRQWNLQYGSNQEQSAFDRWLAQQQLAMQQGQSGQDNSYRNRQLDLQAALQNFQMGPQWQQQVQQQGVDNIYRQQQADLQQGNFLQQFGANRADTAWNQGFQQNEANRAYDEWLQQFGANRADTAWNQGFQQQQFGEGQRQFDVGQGNWQKSYDANRHDALWGQGFQEKQLGENTRQFDTTFGEGQRQFNVGQENWGKEFARQNALDSWSQAFQQAGFDWNKQRAGETDNLQRELASMGAFGRKFGPNISAM